MTIPVELKYETKAGTVEDEVFDEMFTLTSDGARPKVHYRLFRDVRRLEKIVADQGRYGYFVLLTNDANYWTLHRSPRILCTMSSESTRGESWTACRSGRRWGIGFEITVWPTRLPWTAGPRRSSRSTTTETISESRTTPSFGTSFYVSMLQAWEVRRGLGPRDVSLVP